MRGEELLDLASAEKAGVGIRRRGFRQGHEQIHNDRITLLDSIIDLIVRAASHSQRGVGPADLLAVGANAALRDEAWGLN